MKKETTAEAYLEKIMTGPIQRRIAPYTGRLNC